MSLFSFVGWYRINLSHFDLREGNMGKVLGLIQGVLNRNKA
jgi:hypothetical protein